MRAGQLRLHILIIINTYCFSTAIMVKRMRLNVTLYVVCLVSTSNQLPELHTPNRLWPLTEDTHSDLTWLVSYLEFVYRRHRDLGHEPRIPRAARQCPQLAKWSGLHAVHPHQHSKGPDQRPKHVEPEPHTPRRVRVCNHWCQSWEPAYVSAMAGGAICRNSNVLPIKVTKIPQMQTNRT